MIIRHVQHTDQNEWARMRNTLWPDSVEAHFAEIEEFFRGTAPDIVSTFVMERSNEHLGGFIEINIRPFVPGSRQKNVPYIEGWYVDDDIRNMGYGKALMHEAEKWSREQGFSELGSDAAAVNERSIDVHRALGFSDVEHVIHFLKKLV